MEEGEVGLLAEDCIDLVGRSLLKMQQQCRICLARFLAPDPPNKPDLPLATFQVPHHNNLPLTFLAFVPPHGCNEHHQACHFVRVMAVIAFQNLPCTQGLHLQRELCLQLAQWRKCGLVDHPVAGLCENMVTFQRVDLL